LCKKIESLENLDGNLVEYLMPSNLHQDKKYKQQYNHIAKKCQDKNKNFRKTSVTQ
jgi:hypothetical protein